MKKDEQIKLPNVFWIFQSIIILGLIVNFITINVGNTNNSNQYQMLSDGIYSNSQDYFNKLTDSVGKVETRVDDVSSQINLLSNK